MLLKDFRDMLSALSEAKAEYLGVVPERIDLMTSIDGVSFAEAWPARVLTEVDGLQLPVLSREHLLINKRATGRSQDRVDAERLEALGEPPK